jgi:16S rRNA (cytidine1402-2'-O)-methyltransferase
VPAPGPGQTLRHPRHPVRGSRPMSGKLSVCATPIGNLEDVTLRVLSTLRDADLIACEDTRHTHLLLQRHGITGKLVSYHEHNERSRTPELLARIRDGESVALVSDAGMPLVSDPGFTLVRACAEAGLTVEVLPGPSALLTALVASALPADRWCFVGFLPRRREQLTEVLRTPETLVAYESPHRAGATLALLAELDPARTVALCRELTKVHEEVVRGTAAELAERYQEEEPRGELVLVVGAASTGEPDLGPALEQVRRLVAAGAKPRTAASVVAELTGTSANVLYRTLTERPR